MENVESSMEKGEVGEAVAGSSRTTTYSSPETLISKGSFGGKELKSKLATNTHCTTFWRWPSWNPFGQAGQSSGKKYRIPVIVRRLNDCARGYPNLAAFLDSDEGFTIYRRFGYLQSRLLLDKQEELRILEQKLDRMDRKLVKDDKKRLCTRDTFGPDAEKHKELLATIEEKFCSYAKILQAAHQMMSFNKPADSDYESVGRYMNNRQVLIEEEASWINHKEDMITLRAGREHGWLDDVVEGLLRIWHCRLIDVAFRSEETRKKTEIDSDDMLACPPKNEDKHEIYYTPSRIAKLSNGILTALILALLVIPVYILYHLVTDIGTSRAYKICIGTLLLFTLAFSAVLSLFTKAKRHEILAAAAAYCAVLVVFLSNVGPKSVP